MVTLAGTEVQSSKLIFGTSHTFKIRSKSSRLKILQLAVDLGFSHFDTAPLYGYGVTELDIGILKRLNPHITITSKIGIYPPPPNNSWYPLIYAQKAIHKIDQRIMAPRKNFDFSSANQSINDSLRRLKVECIDILLLHEPNFDDVVFDEWELWVEGLKRSGKVRAFGIAGKKTEVSKILDQKLFGSVIIQAEDSISEHDDTDGLPFPAQITYGYFNKALRNKDDLDFASILQKALRKNTKGAIIYGSNNEKHIREVVGIMDKK